MAVVINPFMDIMNKMSEGPDIKRVDIVLPIAKLGASVTCLKTGDDLSIRSSISSPANHDREMSLLLYKRSKFTKLDSDSNDHGRPENFDFDYFCKNSSNIDKSYLLWALYKSTYELIDEKRKINCQNRENCGHIFEEKILLDDLIHEDTFTLWEHETSFNEYLYQITINHDDFILDFAARLPTIEDNNKILSRISNNELQFNLEKTGSMFTKAQQVALLIKAIRLSSKSGKFSPVETTNIQEILISVDTNMPAIVTEEFLEKYSDHFDKYVPKFYKNVTCPKCGLDFKYNVDIEIEFFRRFLYGREKSK